MGIRILNLNNLMSTGKGTRQIEKTGRKYMKITNMVSIKRIDKKYVIIEKTNAP